MDKLSTQYQHCLVALRVKPASNSELAHAPIPIAWNSTAKTITLHGTKQSYAFDVVYGPESSQKQIFEECCVPLFNRFFEGYNCCILTYGQTGSGKTYTLGNEPHVLGLEDAQENSSAGILPRVAAYVFSLVKKKEEEGCTIGLSVSFIEIYNEELRDLLDLGGVSDKSWPMSFRQQSSSTNTNKPIRITENPDTRAISLLGVKSVPVTSEKEILNCLLQGALCRRTASNMLNLNSSRSHSIFTISMISHEKKNDAMGSAKFHFVDLAGSERLKRTQSSGDRLREGISINSGLLALSNVISALTTVESEGAPTNAHVPYRDSKLTRILQDSLGGNSYTLIFACVSSVASDFAETINTVRYAARSRNIQNIPIANHDERTMVMENYQQQIHDLGCQVSLLKKELSLHRANSKENTSGSQLAATTHEIRTLQLELSTLFSISSVFYSILKKQKVLTSIEEKNFNKIDSKNNTDSAIATPLENVNQPQSAASGKEDYQMNSQENNIKNSFEQENDTETCGKLSKESNEESQVSPETIYQEKNEILWNALNEFKHFQERFGEIEEPPILIPTDSNSVRNLQHASTDMHTSLMLEPETKSCVLGHGYNFNNNFFLAPKDEPMIDESKYKGSIRKRRSLILSARDQSFQKKYYAEIRKTKQLQRQLTQVTRQMNILTRSLNTSQRQTKTLEKSLETMRSERSRSTKKLQEHETKFRLLMKKKDSVVLASRKREQEQQHKLKELERHYSQTTQRLQREREELLKKANTLNERKDSHSIGRQNKRIKHSNNEYNLTQPQNPNSSIDFHEFQKMVEMACHLLCLQHQAESVRSYIRDLEFDISKHQKEEIVSEGAQTDENDYSQRSISNSRVKQKENSVNTKRVKFDETVHQKEAKSSEASEAKSQKHLLAIVKEQPELESEAGEAEAAASFSEDLEKGFNALSGVYQEKELCSNFLSSLEQSLDSVVREITQMTTCSNTNIFQKQLQSWLNLSTTNLTKPKLLKQSAITLDEFYTLIFDQVVRLSFDLKQYQSTLSQKEKMLTNMKHMYNQSLKQIELMKTHYEVERLDTLEKTAQETSDVIKWCLNHLKLQNHTQLHLRYRLKYRHSTTTILTSKKKRTLRQNLKRKLYLETSKGEGKFNKHYSPKNGTDQNKNDFSSDYDKNKTPDEFRFSQNMLLLPRLKYKDPKLLNQVVLFQSKLLESQQEQLNSLKSRVHLLLKNYAVSNTEILNDTTNDALVSGNQKKNEHSVNLNEENQNYYIGDQTADKQDTIKLLQSSAENSSFKNPTRIDVDGVMFIRNFEASPSTKALCFHSDNEQDSDIENDGVNAINYRSDNEETLLTSDKENKQSIKNEAETTEIPKDILDNNPEKLKYMELSDGSTTEYENYEENNSKRLIIGDSNEEKRQFSLKRPFTQSSDVTAEDEQYLKSVKRITHMSSKCYGGESTPYNGNEYISFVDESNKEKKKYFQPFDTIVTDKNDDTILLSQYIFSWKNEIPVTALPSKHSVNSHSCLTLSSKGTVALWPLDITPSRSFFSAPSWQCNLPNSNVTPNGICQLANFTYLLSCGSQICILDPRVKDVSSQWTVAPAADTSNEKMMIYALCTMKTRSDSFLETLALTTSDSYLKLFDLRSSKAPIQEVELPCPHRVLAANSDSGEESFQWGGLAAGGIDNVVRYWSFQDNNVDRQQNFLNDQPCELVVKVDSSENGPNSLVKLSFFQRSSQLISVLKSRQLDLWDTTQEPSLISQHSLKKRKNQLTSCLTIEDRITAATCFNFMHNKQIHALGCFGSETGVLEFYESARVSSENKMNAITEFRPKPIILKDSNDVLENSSSSLFLQHGALTLQSPVKTLTTSIESCSKSLEPLEHTDFIFTVTLEEKSNFWLFECTV